MNSNESGPCLFFELTKHENSQIVYPSEEDVFATAAKVVQANDGDNVLLVKGGKQHREQIEDIVKRDSLETMVEQDKELLWKLRFVKCSDLNPFGFILSTNSVSYTHLTLPTTPYV